MVYRSPSDRHDASDEFAVLRAELAAEARLHESFAASRRAIYHPNPDLLARLDDFAEHGGPALVVAGDSGVGKSALLAYWCHNYWLRHPEAFIISHHIGTNGEEHTRMLRRLIGEIKLRYALSRDLPSSPELVVNELPFWLAHVHAETLIVVIDGVDQLDAESDGGKWLPEFFPSNIRLIISGRLCNTLDALRDRGWGELVVERLNDVERAEMARSYLHGRRRTLADAHLHAAASGTMAGNPLFLRTRLDEISLFGHRNANPGIIKRCLTANSLDDLFAGVLQRLEDEFGVDRVQDILCLLWASRHGLRAEDLAQLAPGSAVVIERLEPHIMWDEQEGYRFLHAHFRAAVGYRYVRHEEDIHNAHRRLALYYEQHPLTSSTADMVAWHFYASQDWQQLRNWLGRLDVLAILFRGENRYALLSYWAGLGAQFDAVDVYIESIKQYELNNSDPVDLAWYLYHVSVFLWFDRRGLSTSVALARKSLELRREHLGELHQDTGASYTLLGKILRSQYDLVGAEIMYRRALPILQHCLGREHADVTGLMSSLAVVMASMREPEKLREALMLAESAIEISELHRGPHHVRTAWCYNVMAWVLNASDDLESAEIYLRKSLAIYERMFGPEHPHTAREYFHLAVFLDEKGDHERAHSLFRNVLALRERLLGPRHLEVATTLQVFGLSLLRRDELDESESHLCRSLEIAEQLLGSGHPHVIITLSNLIELMQRREDLVRAKHYLVRLLRAQERHAGPGHSDTVAPILVAVRHRLGSNLELTDGWPELLVPILESEDEDDRLRYQTRALEKIQSVRAFPVMCASYISAFFSNEGLGALLDHMAELFQAALGMDHHDTMRINSIAEEINLAASMG